MFERIRRNRVRIVCECRGIHTELLSDFYYVRYKLCDGEEGRAVCLPNCVEFLRFLESDSEGCGVVFHKAEKAEE